MVAERLSLSPNVLSTASDREWQEPKVSPGSAV